MNAPGAHYVANADAKVQLFSGIAITFYKINNISWFYDTSPSYFMVRFILRFFSLISFKKILYLCVHQTKKSNYGNKFLITTLEWPFNGHVALCCKKERLEH